MNLLPLFLVSLATVGYETALTRYFAVAKWSEYGYWVISIVMVGFALSGVALALFRDAAARHGARLLAWLPAILVLTAAAGFHLTTINPFNPLQLQNQATWDAQLWNIAGYYAALLPFFFLAGVFISLTFILHADRIGRVYGFDLTGAGAGAAVVLLAMHVAPPFALVPLLLIPLACSAVFTPGPLRLRGSVAAAAALAVSELLLLTGAQPSFSDFKAIYAPLNTAGAKVEAIVLSPRGMYHLLDNFTERVDTDISNNAGMLGLPGPPDTFGLYRDGNRIAALPKPGPLDVRYASGTLAALPYALIPRARVLIAGASGGFRVAEALELGAIKVRVLEPEPVLAEFLLDGGGPVSPLPIDPAVRVGLENLATAVNRGVYDIVDVSADFLDAADANVAAFTVESLATSVRQLAPGGMVSIPVSIRDFPVYALRMLATVREAMRAAGIEAPANHVVVYRSAWSVRILLARSPWSKSDIAAIQVFCDARSFDVSWHPGMDVVAARSKIYNDLPSMSFETGQIASNGPSDAIADEAEAVLTGRDTPSAQSFNLSPITLDRPFFHAILRLDQLGSILRRLEILPQAEVGALVNLAVLAQAIVIAALVLLVPLAARGRIGAEARPGASTVSLIRAIAYFPALGLGFLFIEMFFIDKASLWLNDRASGFALVLTGMLVFSGIGSMAAERYAAAPKMAATMVCGIVIAWCIAVLMLLQPLIMATMAWPSLARAGLLLIVLAPASIALGLPFPLGLTRMGNGGFLPWAWGLNGAFSVVATPLATLIAREAGFDRVLLCAAILYGVALIAFPIIRTRHAWQYSTVKPSVALPEGR